MSDKKPFKVLWGIFSQSFEELEEAMEFCARKVIRNECMFAEVVTEKYIPTGDGVSSKKETFQHFSVKKPIRSYPG